MNGLQCPQNVMAPPWGVSMVTRKLFTACDGLDEKMFSEFFWYIDFCLRLRGQSVENVYLPEELAEWYGGIDVNRTTNERKGWEQECHLFQARWRTMLRQGDPYYNRGLLDVKSLPVSDFLQWYTGSKTVE